MELNFGTDSQWNYPRISGTNSSRNEIFVLEEEMKNLVLEEMNLCYSLLRNFLIPKRGNGR